MKRLLLSLVLAMCLWPSSWAEIITGSCGATSDDKVTYSYNTETCHLVFEGKGAIGNGWRDSVPSIPVKTVKIKEGITSLGYACFEHCSSLTSITIPEGVTSLEEACFVECSSLTNVTIPESVTRMGPECFIECSSLTNITIPKSVTSLGPACFGYCSSLTSISLPDGITSMGDWCFIECSSLTNITIPKSVTSMGDWCFKDCESLTGIILPDGITNLGSFCFDGCSSLTNITIPKSVTSLGWGCFQGCTSLTTMVCHSNTPPYILEDAFINVPTDKGTLYVPQAAISAYSNDTRWDEWDKILSIKEDPITPEEPEDKKVCEAPTIRYEEGKLQITSATDGAKCYYSLITADTKTELSEISEFVILEAAYKITAIAKCEGYKDSEKSTATLYWLSGNLDSSTGIESLSASRGVIASCHDGLITLTGLNNNERVQFYSINGVYLGACNAADGGVQFAASRYSGYVIAKVGTHSLRIAVR